MRLKFTTEKNLFASSPKLRMDAHLAALAMAVENKDDPFTYVRLMNEMRQGLILPSDVKLTASKLCQAREKRMAEEEPERERVALALKKHFGLIPL